MTINNKIAFLRTTLPLFREMAIIKRIIKDEKRLLELRGELGPEHTDSHSQRICDLRNEYADIDEVINHIYEDLR